jgi:hypothetical protein
VALLLVVSGKAWAQAPRTSDSNRFGRKYPPRVYQTVLLQGQPPAIDGRLDDEAWKQGEWTGDFRQQTPAEGAPPTQPTDLKILYDEKHIYVAIRAYDDPAKVHRYPGRRDDFNNYAVDIVGICLDSYNSKKSGFEFDITAGGGKVDLILGNGEEEWDTTWDAVWDAKVSHDDKGWSAEFRIPLNQLRYGPEDEQVWGMHVWRWIARNQEEDQWQLIPRQNTGRMHQLGELHGLRALPRTQHLELLPHVLTRASSGPAVTEGASSRSAAGGLDAKVGLTPNFTLDATVNPDFGQVEADPSVMNLTAYEKFYDEKRPFFLEGRDILTLKVEEDDQLFYSRRVGEAPSFDPELAAGERASVPDGTTILGAFKVSGRTNSGLSVAALQGFTQKEVVDITSGSSRREAVVEPFGSYTVGRLHKDWDKGNTSLGTMFTSTHRSVSDAALASALPTQATSAGMDFTRYFANRRWLLEGNGVFSRVSGDRAAILALQKNAVHYYQRPDADHLGIDPSRTSLSGHGGMVRFGLSETSRLTLLNHFHWYSPGLDLNDIGYLKQADLMANQVFVGWSETKPKGVFRTYSFELAREDHWDFGGLQTRRGTQVEASAQFKNAWRVQAGVEYGGMVDTRALRGGPALRLSDALETRVEVSSDYSRRLSVSGEAAHMRSHEGGTEESSIEGSFKLRPTNRLLLSAEVDYEKTLNDLQYVATAESTTGPRWVLGRIDEKVWNITFRVNLALTPELTVQYYGSPFIATGRYSAFKRATDTLAGDYERRFQRLGESEIAYSAASDSYRVSEAGGAAYSFEDPDFRLQEFHSNLVTRWEWKPGSSLYVVWSQGRSGNFATWDNSFSRNWRDMWHARPDNVLMVKFSYWFTI